MEITDAMKKTSLTKPTKERVKDFAASYQALCVRHNLALHIVTDEEVGLTFAVGHYSEEYQYLFDTSMVISKELQEDEQS